MNLLSLSLAAGDYDRVRPLVDGRVAIPGVSLRHVALPPGPLFRRALQDAEFDICEMSFSRAVALAAGPPHAYVALPVFLSRMFRHSAIYIRTDRGIVHPGDLRGRLVGVPDYAMTGAVWARGILKDDYAVLPEELRWRTGGLDEPEASSLGMRAPPGVEIAAIASDQSLSGLLAEGELDALVTSEAPACFRAGDPQIARLFPDFRAAELEWHRRTGLHPIMHVIMLRRDLAAAHPVLPALLFDGFQRAKMLAIADLEGLSTPSVVLPWASAAVASAKEIFGEDYWPYGIAANRRDIVTTMRYLIEQGLLDRAPDLAELFEPSTLPLGSQG